jgi:hypothetical protein
MIARTGKSLASWAHLGLTPGSTRAHAAFIPHSPALAGAAAEELTRG